MAADFCPEVISAGFVRGVASGAICVAREAQERAQRAVQELGADVCGEYGTRALTQLNIAAGYLLSAARLRESADIIAGADISDAGTAYEHVIEQAANVIAACRAACMIVRDAQHAKANRETVERLRSDMDAKCLASAGALS